MRKIIAISIILILLSQIKISCVIPNEAKRSEESVYLNIKWFNKQISPRQLAGRNDTYLLMNFNNLTK